MITHVFYHNEVVEYECAVNSWLSLRSAFGADDEVIVFDLGNTLKENLPLAAVPKFLRIEHVRTDGPMERSYTYGLNMIMPAARFDWIILWRSDYVYHARYIDAVLEEIRRNKATIVLPYECFIGGYYCDYKWARRHHDMLVRQDERDILVHSTVCPVYEFQDQPHFAIRKELWVASGGMDERLYGYGYQFPELLNRLKSLPGYKASIRMDMISFHQTHKGSFGQGNLNNDQEAERKRASENLIAVFTSMEKFQEYREKVKQPPLVKKREQIHYTAITGWRSRKDKALVRALNYLLKRAGNYPVFHVIKRRLIKPGN